MPKSGRALPAPSAETPEGLRVMAERAFRLAMAIPGDTGCQRLLEFAKELETRAAELEAIGAKPLGEQRFGH
jgi:hypothetical protein